MKFEEIFEKLNINQRKAVDTIEGPVLVIAGPGTGKTQILSARIANILRLTDAKPQNILCLTFTDAGVRAMQNRLESMIGSAAYQVNIFTFHALCQRIIRENPNSFGLGLEVAMDLDKIEIINEVIDKLDSKSPLKSSSDTYHWGKNLIDFFNKMRQENLTPKKVELKALKYLKECLDNPEYLYKRNTKTAKKGDLNQNKYNQIEDKMQKLMAAANSYTSYKKIMFSKGMFDFNDMITWVLDAFKKDENLLLSYQELFQYFLVDEFQDTNGAQFEILDLLTSYWEAPNLFVVGDDDQSIFKFQGAEVENINSFYKNYNKSASIVALTDNYRSTQSILDFSSLFIQQNQERLTNTIKNLNKSLISSGQFKALENKPEILSFQNKIEESHWTCHTIKDLINAGTKADKIAIIYKTHKQADNYLKLLTNLNIPFELNKQIDILQNRIIRQLLNLMDYAALENTEPDSGNHLIMQILQNDIYGISSATVSEIFYLKREYREIPWRSFLLNIQQYINDFTKFKLSINIVEAKNIGEKLDFFIKTVGENSVPIFIESLLTKSQFLSHLLKDPDQSNNMNILRSFMDFAKSETDKNPFISVTEFLDKVKLMQERNIPLAANKHIGTKKGIVLTTYHSAKGLEWEHVFLIENVADNWKSYERDFGIRFILGGEKDDTEEKRRLFYVGMTRAEKNLYLSKYKNKENGKAAEPSIFIQEIIELTDSKEQEIKVEDKSLLQTEAILLESLNFKSVNSKDSFWLNQWLSNYALSPTNMTKYEKCPVSFYYDTVLRVPSATHNAAAIGTAVHNTFQKYFNIVQESPTKSFPEKSEIQRIFKHYFEKQKGAFKEENYKHKLIIGQQLLTDYIDYALPTWQKNKIFEVEKNLNTLILDGVPIKGMVDKVLYEEKNAYPVDYKTASKINTSTKSRAPKVNSLLEANNFQDYYGGEYWQQIIFYAWLIRLNDSTKKTPKGIIENLPFNGKNEFLIKEIEITEEGLEKVKQNILEVWEGISNFRFDKGCQEDNCNWCNFVKETY